MNAARAALLALMVLFGNAAHAAVIKIENWQFTWGGDQFQPGIGWIWDMDGAIAPFQIGFNQTSAADPLGPINDWLMPYENSGYTFAPIHLEFIQEDANGPNIYYTSIGKGEWFSGGDNPYNDGVTFSGVGLEITQAAATVPEPGMCALLALGFVAVSLSRSRGKLAGKYSA